MKVVGSLAVALNNWSLVQLGNPLHLHLRIHLSALKDLLLQEPHNSTLGRKPLNTQGSTCENRG